MLKTVKCPLQPLFLLFMLYFESLNIFFTLLPFLLKSAVAPFPKAEQLISWTVGPNLYQYLKLLCFSNAKKNATL